MVDSRQYQVMFWVRAGSGWAMALNPSPLEEPLDWPTLKSQNWHNVSLGVNGRCQPSPVSIATWYPWLSIAIWCQSCMLQPLVRTVQKDTSWVFHNSHFGPFVCWDKKTRNRCIHICICTCVCVHKSPIDCKWWKKRKLNTQIFAWMGSLQSCPGLWKQLLTQTVANLLDTDFGVMWNIFPTSSIGTLRFRRKSGIY